MFSKSDVLVVLTPWVRWSSLLVEPLHKATVSSYRHQLERMFSSGPLDGLDQPPFVAQCSFVDCHGA